MNQKYLGVPAIDSVYDLMRDTTIPIRSDDIMEITGKQRSQVNECLNALAAQGIVSWRYVGRGHAKEWSYIKGKTLEPGTDPLAGKQINTFIVDYLKAHGPKRRGELAAEIGVRPNRISDCINRLKAAGRIREVPGTRTGPGSGYQYTLTENFVPMVTEIKETRLSKTIALLKTGGWWRSRTVAKIMKVNVKRSSDDLCHLVRRGLAESREVHSANVPHRCSEYHWLGTPDE